jgi:hypothetical protein
VEGRNILRIAVFTVLALLFIGNGHAETVGSGISVDVFLTNQSKYGPEVNFVIENMTTHSRKFSLQITKDVAGEECEPSASREPLESNLVMAEKNTYFYSAVVAPRTLSASYVTVNVAGGDVRLPCTFSYRLLDEAGRILVRGHRRVEGESPDLHDKERNAPDLSAMRVAVAKNVYNSRIIVTSIFSNANIRNRRIEVKDKAIVGCAGVELVNEGGVPGMDGQVLNEPSGNTYVLYTILRGVKNSGSPSCRLKFNLFDVDDRKYISAYSIPIVIRSQFRDARSQPDFGDAFNLSTTKYPEAPHEH